MADIIWPDSIPIAPLLAKYQERYSSVVSSVTTGNKSILVRRNATRAQTRLTVSFMLKAKQVEYFLTFFNDVLDGGSCRFTFEHPRTHKDIECSFDPTLSEPYTITPAGNATMKHFQVDTTFIVWD